MKIEDNSPSTVVDLLKHQKVEQNPSGVNGGKGAEVAAKTDKGGDKVDISVGAERVNKTSISLKGPENFREDKVAEIQSKIDAGTYQVSGRDVAEKLIAALSKTK
ncbi:flagellar biosynthesis anti-sigma factor FlgM [Geotalea toluenoxydans]|uniref:flagellar biosynthesis anti-sigma factor FlgM n=1 Tax=Geotalea toluenoxydans TaxID=421624 RepID=UPI0006D20CBC|nr:flagellar biosynthesis anti-sigma factor FlgM [Geotalea toluenoxydans]